MPVTQPKGGPVRWFSARAVLLHVLVIVAVPLCLFAGWWQATRAMSGNLLSYFYAIEWPAFAVLSIFGWWQLVHAETGARTTPIQPAAPSEHGTGPTVTWDPALESSALRSYNRYLAD